MESLLDTSILESYVLNPQVDSQSTRVYENLVYGEEQVVYGTEEVVY